MKFDLVDRVVERDETRAVTVKQVTAAEEYLADHFPSYPVLPGVLMLEAMVQAARLVTGGRMVLGSVRALKYGSFVTPGSSLRVEVELTGRGDDGSPQFKGRGVVVRDGEEIATAVSGRFTLRPLRS